MTGDDLATWALPVAADLATSVDQCDNEGIAQMLNRLDRQELYAVAVVLAAHVDTPMQDRSRDAGDIDPVVVERIMLGDTSLCGVATRAERAEVCDRWMRQGRSLASLRQETGWKPERYGTARCGTDGGYYRHLRTVMDEPCDDCRTAHAAAERVRKQPPRQLGVTVEAIEKAGERAARGAA